MCGGAEEGVGVKGVSWKMGQPAAGGTGCRGLLVAGGWWAESSVGGGCFERGCTVGGWCRGRGNWGTGTWVRLSSAGRGGKS